MDVIYLDHNASSPVPPELTETLGAVFAAAAGNPSSLHRAGRKSRRLINDATESLARHLDCDPEFVYWTSGASESNTWALHSAAEAARSERRKPRFLISSIEHESVLLAAGRERADVAFVRCLPNGRIDAGHLRELLSRGPRPDLVSVLHASNETGVFQPIEEVAATCREYGVPLHVDCVQSLGKERLSLRRMGATYATFSGHKIGAPKGVGALVVQGEGRLLHSLVAGKQQKALRGGTENPVGAALFGRLVAGIDQGREVFPEALGMFHRDFEAELRRRVPGTVVHGDGSPRLRNTTFVGFEGADGDGILMNLDLEGVCASSGSACTSGSLDPSHVLLAMGCDKAMARSSVRFSSGRGTEWQHFERALAVLPDIVERVRVDS